MYRKEQEHIENGKQSIRRIPHAYHTEAIALLSVQRTGAMLNFVCGNVKTLNVCVAAVQNHFSALKYVPWRLRNEEMCANALQQNITSMDFVPKHIWTVALVCFPFIT